jgi:hypothetical protein
MKAYYKIKGYYNWNSSLWSDTNIILFYWFPKEQIKIVDGRVYYPIYSILASLITIIG